MQNQIQAGNVITVDVIDDVKSGDGMLVGAIFGIATADGTFGNEVEVALTGVFEMPKKAVTLAQGDLLYWDDAAKNVSTGQSNGPLIGFATELATSTATTVRARLNGVAVV